MRFQSRICWPFVRNTRYRDERAILGGVGLRSGTKGKGLKGRGMLEFVLDCGGESGGVVLLCWVAVEDGG